jgi:acyl-lipid omega-6 desaturase (Delta-12 desaturase)
VALGYVSLALNPYSVLFPLLWVFTGTALTGFFVLAHDSGHRSFSPRRWENDLVGHVLLLPLLYPFHCWRIMHDKHHKYTNHIEEDNAWAPLRPEVFQSLPPVFRFLYAQARGYFWWLASIGHWLAIHFNPKLYREQDRKDATFSMRLVQAFALVLFPTLFYIGSLSGGVLGGFWTIINFYEAQQWTAVTGQLFSTIHCDFPAWVEYLCHNINVHIPHHVSTAIPSYNLPKAHKEIKARWGPFIHETRFDWPLMKGIVRSCHLYNDEDGYYRAVQDLKD